MRSDCPLPAAAEVWTYSRHSPGPRQDIASQLNDHRRYAAAHGLVITRQFTDEAKSGSTEAGREEFMRLMSIAEAHDAPPCAGLLVTDWSRFARDVQDALYYSLALERRGWVIVNLTQPDIDGPYRYVLRGAHHGADEDFLNKLKAAQRRGFQALVDSGFVPTGTPIPPYEAYHVPHGNKQGVRWRLVTDQVPVAVKAWTMKAAGATYHKIWKACAGLGYENPYSLSGFFFGNSCHAPIGYIVRKGARVPVPAYLDKHVWDRVQAQRTTINVPDHPRRKSSPYILSGLLRCPKCDAEMTGTSGKNAYGTKYQFYRCRNRQHYKSCNHPIIPRHKVEVPVVRRLFDWWLDGDLEKAIERANAELALADSAIRQDADRIDAMIAETQTEIDNLVDWLAQIRPEDNSALARKYAELENRLLELEGQRAETAPAILTPPAQFIDLADWSVEDMRGMLDDAGIRMLIDHIEPYLLRTAIAEYFDRVVASDPVKIKSVSFLAPDFD